jgi:hypothetical protein
MEELLLGVGGDTAPQVRLGVRVGDLDCGKIAPDAPLRIERVRLADWRTRDARLDLQFLVGVAGVGTLSRSHGGPPITLQITLLEA